MRPTNPAIVSVRCAALIFAFGGLRGPVSGQPSDHDALPPPPAPVSAKSAPMPRDPKLPTIFIAGDSTAAPNGGGIVGWGVPFPDYFDPAKVNVVNRARGGRSSRTFITEGLWDQLLAQVKAGDFVLIQFGHNDAGAINEEPPGSKYPLRARGSLPGLGDEAREIDNIITKKHEIVQTFGWYVRKMVADVKAKDAHPILLSLTVRDEWKDGMIEWGSGHFGEWMEAIAHAEKVPFLDLTSIVASRCQIMGPAKVKAFFPRDHTHTNAAGADLNAAGVVAGLKGLRGLPFAQYFSAKGEAVTPDRIAWLHLPRPADPKLPSLFLIGDSTVRNGRGDGEGGQWGWGDYLAPYFDTKRLNVVNRAVGGLSSRTFLTQGHWERVLSMLKPGDFVMMQFGHNDSGAYNDTSRARGTIKGVGEEIEEIDNLLTKEHETVHTYGWYLRKFIADARAKGATPIMCSLVPRKTWKDGKIVRSKDSYAGWAEQVAQAEHAPFVDLNEIIARRYDQLGPEKVEPLFADPHTHTSLAGAELNAASVVSGLKSLKDDPVVAFFSEKAKDVPLYSADP